MYKANKQFVCLLLNKINIYCYIKTIIFKLTFITSSIEMAAYRSQETFQQLLIHSFKRHFIKILVALFVNGILILIPSALVSREVHDFARRDNGGFLTTDTHPCPMFRRHFHMFNFYLYSDESANLSDPNLIISKVRHL